MIQLSIQAIFEWFKRKISGGEKKQDRSSDEDIHALLIDTYAESEAGDLTTEIRTIDQIALSCRRMQHAETKGDLIRLLATEVKRFSLRDLEMMYARFEEKTRNLPNQYRDLLLPKVKEQIFPAHHRLLLLARNGAGDEEEAPLQKEAGSYFIMVEAAAREKAKTNDPTFLYLKYLLAGFWIFVMEEPAHPIGTPFPGGQIVDAWEGEYLCPVRDKADGIPFALCPFCPARQSDEPTYPEMREVRKERRRKESLNNYWTNYKG